MLPLDAKHYLVCVAPITNYARLNTRTDESRSTLVQIGRMEDLTKVTLPFPARTRQETATVDKISTIATVTDFSDKILLTISQDGKLAQWLSVPLLSDNPTSGDPYFNVATGEDLMPVARFQPRVVLGAGGGERETTGLLLASQIASLITTKTPDESRVLMLGLGLTSGKMEREAFLEVLDLITKVL